MKLISQLHYSHSDRTPMHLAAERGHTATVEFLADKFKASVFDRTKDGSTLMHIAALNGHPDTAMVLFKKGVPLLMPNKVYSVFQEKCCNYEIFFSKFSSVIATFVNCLCIRVEQEEFIQRQ